MAKTGMDFISKDGEVLEDVFVKLNGEIYPLDGDWRMSADFVNSVASKEDIRIYEKPSPIIRETEDFGELKDLQSSKRLSKLFQYEDPEFSKDGYYKYWYKLCLRADQDTNIIFERNPIHYVTTNKEIIKMCQGSRNIIYKFLRECKEKNLISRFTHKKNKLFILNPKYVFNGKEIPLAIYDLFNKPLEDLVGREAV